MMVAIGATRLLTPALPKIDRVLELDGPQPNPGVSAMPVLVSRER
jgi:hypothetical protein